MSKEELGRFFNEFNPDSAGKVSNQGTLATCFARSGKDIPATAAASPASAASTLGVSSDRPTSRNQGAEKLRGRRQNSSRCAHGKDELGGFSSVRPFLPYRMQGVAGEVTDDAEGSIASTRLLLPRGKTILAISTADGGTKAVGDAEERIDFQGFRANVERAKETAGVMDGGIQAEARTPPAMERNLFLSALANGKLEHHRDDLVITLKRVVAGGLAGMLAKSVVAPVDRVKILFQVTNEKFSFKRAEKLFHDILALEGPAGLWKGNSATLIRVFPYAGTQFMMFDSLKRWALLRKTRRDPNAEQRLSNLESLMSGSFAGAFSALVTYPLDLARARLAVGHARKLGGRRRTMGVPQLLRSVVRQDGFRALYRGVTPSLLGIIPYAGIAFSINEQAKHEVLVLTGKEPGMFHKLGIGALAGLIAQSCTYPLEVTRRRMQTHGLIDSYAGVNKVFEVPKSGVSTEAELIHRLNIFQTFKAVFQEQGMRGLFKGLSMNWVKGPVGISISFTTFDFLKRQFGIS